MQFIGVTGMVETLFTDLSFAESHGAIKGRVSPAALVYTIIEGLLCQATMQTTGLALLEVEKKVLKPVFAGDTIHAQVEVTGIGGQGEHVRLGAEEAGIDGELDPVWFARHPEARPQLTKGYGEPLEVGRRPLGRDVHVGGRKRRSVGNRSQSADDDVRDAVTVERLDDALRVEGHQARATPRNPASRLAASAISATRSAFLPLASRSPHTSPRETPGRRQRSLFQRRT